MIEGSRPAPCSTVAAGTLTIRRLAGRHGLLLDGEADLNSYSALRSALPASCWVTGPARFTSNWPD